MRQSAIRARFDELLVLLERHPLRLLAILLVAYLAMNCWWQDVSTFGQLHDDTLYFSSAKALAEGRGYIVPSLPGTPYQTKYPILYPWVLSLVWRIDPEFPRNVNWAFLLTSLFGAGFVAGCYALVRSLGHRTAVALLIAAACAFQPMTQFLSASLLSDIPFMALAVWAMALSERWLNEREDGRRRQLFTAVTVLVALAILMRTIGLALVAGIFVVAVLRGARRAGLLFATTVCAVIAAAAGWSYTHRIDPEILAAADSGYRQTLLFYTDYLGFWRASVPDTGTFWVMILFNSVVGLIDLAQMVFGELGRVGEGPLPKFVLLTISMVTIIAALQRCGRRFQAVQCVFLFYSVVVVLWNYALAWRLMVLFLPLLFVGAYRIMKAVTGVCASAVRSGTVVERLIGIVGLIAIAGISLNAVYSHLWSSPRMEAEERAARARGVSQRLAAYAWIATNTAPAARIVSYEDALLYLHTGRQGMRPLQLLTAPSYDPDTYPVLREAAHIGDTARAIAADYWLVSEDDWSVEGGKGVDELRSETIKALASCPIAAEFEGGAVVIRRMNEGRCDVTAESGR